MGGGWDFGLGAIVVRAREMFTAEGRCEVPDAGGYGVVDSLCADGLGGSFPWKIPREESKTGKVSSVWPYSRRNPRRVGNVQLLPYSGGGGTLVSRNGRRPASPL